MRCDMTEKQYQISASELERLTKDASISNAIKELADVLSGRSNDVPSRFRVPARFAEYISDFGINTSMYHQLQLGYDSRNPLILRMTSRPTQKILELGFDGADGTRLFTLELDYALPEKG